MAHKKVQVIMKTCIKLGACLVLVCSLSFGRRVKGDLDRDFLSSYKRKAYYSEFVCGCFSKFYAVNWTEFLPDINPTIFFSTSVPLH